MKLKQLGMAAVAALVFASASSDVWADEPHAGPPDKPSQKHNQKQKQDKQDKEKAKKAPPKPKSASDHAANHGPDEHKGPKDKSTSKSAAHPGDADSRKAKHAALEQKKKERREDRDERREEQKAKQRIQLTQQNPKVLEREGLRQEFEKHAKRTASLSHARDVAVAEQRDDMVARIDRLIAKENARHNSWVNGGKS